MTFSSDSEILFTVQDSQISEFSVSTAISNIDEIHVEILLSSPGKFVEMKTFLNKLQSRQISYFNVSYKEGSFINCILHSIIEETNIPSMANGWIPAHKFSLVLRTKAEFKIRELPVLRILEKKEKLLEAEKAILNFLKD